jgi:hypothetical protein
VARELLGPEPQPPAAEGVLERGSDADPWRRYPTATEFVLRLTDAFESPPAPTRVEELPELDCRHPHRARRPLVRFVALVGVLALMASSALGALAVQRYREVRPAAAPIPVGTCTLSPLDHDANAVARGRGAIEFCRDLARQLTSSDLVWSFRSGRRLLVPDGGDLSRLGLVCDAVVRGLSVRVYDDGSRSLGGDLCRGFARRGGQVTQLAAF